MRRHSLAVILAAALPLCGFGSCGQTQKPELPKVVHVAVERPIGVPKALTARCPVNRAEQRTIESVVSAYNANIISLEQCNSQLGAIEKLGTEAARAGER